ncbi:MAG: glycosyltransferase family 4 protein [Actinomycetota bacterium]|nr:glycosyltransferase family 4 protein [Actinomycetota bacterium]
MPVRSPRAPADAPTAFDELLPRARRRPLRIAHLTTVDMSLALLLGTELGLDVKAGFAVYGISAPGPWVDKITGLGVTHVPVPSLTRAWDPRRDLAAGRELWGALRELELDVLHTHNPKTGVLGRVLGRAARIPVIVNTCHGLWASSDDPVPKRVLVSAVEALSACCSDAELYQNNEDLRRLRWAVGRRRALTVGNGVDLTRFRPDPGARASMRAELGVGDDELVVGGVGRRVAEKGVREFAAAANALADHAWPARPGLRPAPARFIWVGPQDPDKADGVVDGLEGVQFLGTRDDMERVYAALDVFVLPSYREGFSRSAMEAAATGCAMVLSDIRGCREVGADGHELLLVPARNTQALVEAVACLLANPGLRRRLGTNARERALREFDQGRIAATSVATYREVARSKGLAW